jgi:electron transfer flavoprotein alpha subunit
MKTLVYIDHFKGQAMPASWEALGAGKNLGSVSAVIFGQNLEALAKEAFEYGADEVLLCEDASLLDYRAEAFSASLPAPHRMPSSSPPPPAVVKLPPWQPST